MENTVVYLGRCVPMKTFRAFVYGPNEQMHLANSWFEYEDLISSGLWFPTLGHLEKAMAITEPAPEVVAPVVMDDKKARKRGE